MTDRIVSRPAISSPKVTVSNGGLDIDIWLPDAETGQYRGARFSWAGIIAQASYRGHTWFGEWRDTPSGNEHHDHVTGTAGEFGMGKPLGYDDAEPGGTFVKIGVGVLRRIKERFYRFAATYELVESPAWDIAAGEGFVEMRQCLQHGTIGYDYSYRLEVLAGSFVTSHRLVNTGSRQIHQTHYSHNFFVLDGLPVGPGCEVVLPFEATAPVNRLGPVKIVGNRLDFSNGIGKPGGVFAELAGYANTAADNAVTIRNGNAGIGVHVTGDCPVHHYNFFATPRTMCPEPFVDIVIDSGTEFAWSHRYDLFIE